MSYGIGCRCGSDLTLLWPWRRLMATAPVGPLAWEPPYTMGAALKREKDKKKKKREREREREREKPSEFKISVYKLPWHLALIVSINLPRYTTLPMSEACT